MRRAGLIMTLTFAVGLLVSSTEPAYATSRLAPDAAPQPMVEAIVVLSSQADLNGVRSAHGRFRAGAVESALRTHADRTQRGLRELLARRSAQGFVGYVKPLWITDAIAVSAAPSVIRELAARPDVREVRPNIVVTAPQTTSAMLDPGPTESNVELVNAPALWDLGYRGQGVVVANMDTGVDVTHPDLSSRWRGGTNSWYDPNGQHLTTPTDVSGHGTWTMGVMVGGSAGGTAIGIAPEAQWIAVKIFNDQGVSNSTVIHQGFQWLLDPDGNPATPDAPDVVNNSWTMTNAGCLLDFEPDLQNLRAAGILPIFSAGNYGPTSGTSHSPANNPEAFAVGATDDSDVIDGSSARGPSSCDQPVYPQLAAPGVGVRTTDLYGLYADETGTSMSAPHVAGALALLLQGSPDLPADRQAAALEAGAVDLGTAGPDDVYGYGRLDVLASYQWLGSAPDFTTTVSPTSVSTAQGGTVTYTISVASVNGFVGDVSLALSGVSPAEGTWSFDPPVVATGAGSSVLTVSTAASIPGGTYPLTITATSDATVHSVPATLVVTAPADFGLTASPASRSVLAGKGTVYTVGVIALNGFTGAVSLSLSGLPSNVGTATFYPGIVAGAGSSQLSVATLATAPGGTYTLTITGTSGGLSHTATVTLVVTARDFNLSVAPSTVTVNRGQSADYTVTVTVVGGTVGNVTLTATGLPAGATATFNPNPVGSPGSSTLTVKTTGATPRGAYTLHIRGTAGSLTHETSAQLVVR